MPRTKWKFKPVLSSSSKTAKQQIGIVGPLWEKIRRKGAENPTHMVGSGPSGNRWTLGFLPTRTLFEAKKSGGFGIREGGKLWHGNPCCLWGPGPLWQGCPSPWSTLWGRAVRPPYVPQAKENSWWTLVSTSVQKKGHDKSQKLYKKKTRQPGNHTNGKIQNTHV